MRYFNLPDAVMEYLNLVYQSCAAMWIGMMLMVIQAYCSGTVSAGGRVADIGDVVYVLVLTFVVFPAFIKLVETVVDYAFDKLLK